MQGTRVFRQPSIRFAYQYLHSSIGQFLAAYCLALTTCCLRISREIFHSRLIPILRKIKICAFLKTLSQSIAIYTTRHPCRERRTKAATPSRVKYFSIINDNNLPKVGAGHAREVLYREHGPLLQLIPFLIEIGITSSWGRYHV